MTYRPRTAALAVAALALVACGSDQDPAIDVPSDDPTTTTAAADASEGATGGEPLSFGPIDLTGAAEVPGPGDEDGAGVANVFLEPEGEPAGTICYDFIGIDGIDAANAAHIHQGQEGEAGDVVLPLETPSEGSLDACVGNQAELVEQIRADPAGFYVNVHNEEFEAGAIRGQLES